LCALDAFLRLVFMADRKDNVYINNKVAFCIYS